MVAVDFFTAGFSGASSVAAAPARASQMLQFVYPDSLILTYGGGRQGGYRVALAVADGFFVADNRWTKATFFKPEMIGIFQILK